MVAYLDRFRFFCGISICGSNIKASSIIGQSYHLCYSKRQVLLLLGALDTSYPDHCCVFSLAKHEAVQTCIRLPSSNESSGLNRYITWHIFKHFSFSFFVFHLAVGNELALCNFLISFQTLVMLGCFLLVETSTVELIDFIITSTTKR